MSDLPEDEFWDTYGPFEIFETDAEIPSDLDEHRAWTIVSEPGDPSEKMYALPGFHRVNRDFVVESSEPWTDEQTTGLWYDPYAWEEDE